MCAVITNLPNARKCGIISIRGDYMKDYKQHIIYYTDEAILAEKDIDIYASPKGKCVECVKRDGSHIWISLEDAFDLGFNFTDHCTSLGTKQQLISMIQLGITGVQDAESVALALEIAEAQKLSDEQFVENIKEMLEEQDHLTAEQKREIIADYQRETDAISTTHVSSDSISLAGLKDVKKAHERLPAYEKSKFDFDTFVEQYAKLRGKQGNDRFGRTQKTFRELITEIDQKMGQDRRLLDRMNFNGYQIGYMDGFNSEARNSIFDYDEEYQAGYNRGYKKSHPRDDAKDLESKLLS